MRSWLFCFSLKMTLWQRKRIQLISDCQSAKNKMSTSLQLLLLVNDTSSIPLAFVLFLSNHGQFYFMICRAVSESSYDFITLNRLLTIRNMIFAITISIDSTVLSETSSNLSSHLLDGMTLKITVTTSYCPIHSSQVDYWYGHCVWRQ